GVAQVAMQQGRYAGRLIRRRLAGQSPKAPFRYFDKGTMAVVGRGYAVLETGRVHVSGLPAWLVWAAVHLEFLAESNLRVSVFLQWVWSYVTGRRGSRLILDRNPPRTAGEAPGIEDAAREDAATNIASIA